MFVKTKIWNERLWLFISSSEVKKKMDFLFVASWTKNFFTSLDEIKQIFLTKIWIPTMSLIMSVPDHFLFHFSSAEREKEKREGQCVCVCVCLCVRERERKREREGERERVLTCRTAAWQQQKDHYIHSFHFSYGRNQFAAEKIHEMSRMYVLSPKSWVKIISLLISGFSREISVCYI